VTIEKNINKNEIIRVFLLDREFECNKGVFKLQFMVTELHTVTD